MRKESGLSKVGGWLAGIAATVISGWLVWYFSQPKPQPPQSPQPAVTTFEGMVYSGNAPVAKALVAVDLTGTAGANGAIHDLTDGNGAYKIEMTGLPQGTSATLSVAAQGYENAAPKILAGPLDPDVRVDIALSPAPTPMPVAVTPGPAAGGGGGGGGGNGSAAPPPAHPLMAHIPLYVPKSAAMAMKFQIPVKKQ